MKKLASVLIGAALIMPQSGAFAAQNIGVSAIYDATSDKVIINGTAASGDVIVVVTDFEENTPITTENLPYDFFSAKSDGEFETYVTLTKEAKGKKLSVEITDSDGDTAVTSFMYPDFSGTADVLESLNNASSVEEFSKIVSDNALSLGIDTYDELYKSKKDVIFSVMYAIKKDDASGTDIYDSYYRAHTLVSLNGKTASECEEVLKNSGAIIGIDYDADYESDERLSDASRLTLCKLLSEADFSKVLSVSESFSDFFEKSKAVSAISTAETWQNIKSVMEEDFADLFVLTETGTRAQNVYAKMMNYTYGSFDDVKSGYRRAVTEVYNQLNDNDSDGNYGGGGGSGSGGSFGGSVKLPTGVVIDTTTQPPSSIPAQSGQKQDMITLPSDGYSSYTDVPSNHWSYKAVSLLSGAGVVSGYPDGSFGASSNITRAEFAKLVCISFGIPSVKADFDDVSDDAWYNGYVGGGAKFGLINGYGNNFGPDDFITRQDAAVIVYRALKNEGMVLNGDAIYDDDIDISLYAITAVGALRANEIMVGNNSKFLPLNNITRAEAAQLIYKAVLAAQNR